MDVINITACQIHEDKARIQTLLPFLYTAHLMQKNYEQFDDKSQWILLKAVLQIRFSIQECHLLSIVCLY